MTTILSGGRYAPAEPPPEVIEIAERAARHFGLLFTGVDFMETPDGGWSILEVSAFGGFRGLHTARGLDAAPRSSACRGAPRLCRGATSIGGFGGPVARLPNLPDTPFAVDLRFADVPVRVLTNAAEIWTGLRRYFAPWVQADGDDAALTVRLVQAEAPALSGFVAVARGDGKPPKEAVCEVPGGRLVRKLTTGVLMGLTRDGAFAIGDLVRHLNQGINLVNNRYADLAIRRGHLLLHASAVARDGRAVALAGPPGAGKSTSALHLVEHGLRFVSNDRLLVRAGTDAVEALGYPKQPRVNPGTLLHHVRLSFLLKPDDRAALAALPPAELWKLERKCDVDLETIYGAGTFTLSAHLHALLILTWRPSGSGFTVRRLDRSEALACLPLIRKDLGAFDRRLHGGPSYGPPIPPDARSAPAKPWPSSTPPPDARSAPAKPWRSSSYSDRLAYSALFARIAVVEVGGRVDFPALVPIVEDLLARP